MLVTIKAKLLDAGKTEGCVSFTLINELLPDDIKETSIIEEIFDFLADNFPGETGQTFTPDNRPVLVKKTGNISEVVIKVLAVFLVPVRVFSQHGTEVFSFPVPMLFHLPIEFGYLLK